MVRKIKDWKKDQTKVKDIYETKREKDWDERFIYNKLENNQEIKRTIPKKNNDYSSNIKYLKEQFNSENIKKNNNNKGRGKSGYKIYKEKNNNDKIKINGNQLFKNNNNNIIKRNNLNITEENLQKTHFKLKNKNNISLDNNNNDNIIFYNNNINNNNKYYLMPITELEICVEILWQKLGVKEIYKNKFNKLKMETANDEIQKEFLVKEVENLEKLDIFMNTLYSNIKQRENAISILKKLVDAIEKQFIQLNLEIRDNILNDFYQTLKVYRINTINVVEKIYEYRQLFTYELNKGKFCENILKKNYNLINNEWMKYYRGNYLLKITEDINFLGKSKINGYKNLNLFFCSKNDPFLLNISEIIPINKEYHPRIKQCQYIITQEIIYSEINSEINNDNNNNIININKNNKMQNLKEKNNNNGININNKYTKKEKEKISCINKNNINDNNTNKIKKTEKIIIGAQLIDKMDCNKFFGANDIIEETSEEQILLDIKKGLNDIHNLNKNKKQKLEEKNKDEKENENNKLNNKKLENENNIKEKINISQEKTEEKNMIENSNKIENKIIEEKNNDNIQIEENKEKKETIDNEKEEENKLLNNKNELNKNNNNIIKEESLKEISINSSELTDKNEEIQKIKNIESKKEYKDNNEDIVNIQEKLEENNNIINQNQNKDNNIENNSLINSQIKKSHSRSLTPKSQRESRINLLKEKNEIDINQINKDNNQSNTDIFNNNDNEKKIINNDIMSFYLGKLTDFISIYNNYYNNISQEQKIIFNIKQNPLEYIHNNFYPKIIIYQDKKNKIIKGLCIISHIFWKKNEIYIEHISSYKDEEKENIFEKFISFIKENAFKILGYDNNIKENDIYIDLYYKSEEGKFTINETIRDFFRNKLKFKWVKLENISKYERYMKIRHHFGINNENNLLNNEYDDNNILNQSILGKKEFNNLNNNESDNEESEDTDDINLDISKAFEIQKDKININNNLQELNNFYKIKNILNNFSIKNKTILKFNNKIYENKNDSFINIKYSNPFNFVYLINKVNHSENKNLKEIISFNINSYFSQNDSEIIKQSINKFKKIKLNLIPENINYYSDITELNKQIVNKFKINANINILPPFDNCISFIYNGYYYNRIEIKKIEIFIEKETEQIFYMISKNENHAILISSDLNDNFIQKFINKENNNNKDNISINFMNIYNNLINKDNTNNNVLYIPSFEIKSKIGNNCYKKNEPNKTYNLYCYEDYYNVKFFTEELSINRNINKNKIRKNDCIKMNFNYDLINDEIINQNTFIKNNFLLIAFDLNIMEHIRDFPLMTLYVTKDNFIKI